MKPTLIIALACAGLATGTVATGCGGDDDSGESASSATAATTAATTTATTASESEPADASRKRRRGARVKVMDSQFGRVLFDGKGRALYLFTREKGSKSRCYGACARAWPPFFTRGRPRARAGAETGLLGTTTRRDGRRQVTYDGHPLYYYVSDRRPGQITCQNVAEFGGTWLVVAPDGQAVQ